MKLFKRMMLIALFAAASVTAAPVAASASSMMLKARRLVQDAKMASTPWLDVAVMDFMAHHVRLKLAAWGVELWSDDENEAGVLLTALF